MAKFCTNCGTELNEQQDICLKCGVRVNKEKTVNTKKLKSIIESPSNHQYFAQMKRIKVAILAPNGSLYNFKFLRGNY